MKKILVLFLLLVAMVAQVKASNSATLYVGQTTIFAAPTPPSGTALNQTAWGCSNAHVSVEKYGNTGCRVKVLSYFTGRAEIRCDYYYYWYDLKGYMHTNHASTYYYVTCNPVNLNVSPSQMALNVGEGQRISCSYSPSNVSPKPTIRYISNNTLVATVNSDGYVKAVGSGSTYILVENSAGPSAKCYVDVKSVNPTGVSLSPAMSLNIDEEKTLTASLSPSGAKSGLTWWSDDERVAKVSLSGVVKGISKGSTKVWVKTDVGGYTASCQVNVNEPRLSFESSVPKNEATAVDVNQPLSVTFSLAIYKGSRFDEMSLKTADDASSVDGEVKIDGKSIVFTPKEALKSNTSYVLTLPARAVQNKWGTAYGNPIKIAFCTAIRPADIKWLRLDMGKVNFMFPLSEAPSITYDSEGNIECRYGDNRKSIIVQGNLKYTLTADPDLPNAISVVSKLADGHIIHDGAYLRITDFEPNESVRVYDSAGVVVFQMHTSESGACFIPVSKFQHGTYVVKVGGISSKFIIK